MIRRIEQKELEALARLSRTPDGEVLIKLLSAEIQTVQDRLIDIVPDHVARLQGHARVIKDLHRLLVEAQELVNKRG